MTKDEAVKVVLKGMGYEYHTDSYEYVRADSSFKRGDCIPSIQDCIDLADSKGIKVWCVPIRNLEGKVSWRPCRLFGRSEFYGVGVPDQHTAYIMATAESLTAEEE